MKSTILKYLIITAIIMFAVFLSDLNYKYGDFKDFTSMLMGVSAMVFTIMGIWIAFLYPDALKRFVENDSNKLVLLQAKKDTTRLQAIVLSVLKSALVVTVIMMLFLLKLILSATSLYIENLLLIKQMVLVVTILMCYIQLESIFSVVISNIYFLNDLHSKKEQRESTDDL